MTDAVTSQNIDISSWGTRYTHYKIWPCSHFEYLAV